MKHSISKIFQNLNMYMFFVLFASFLTLALTLEHQLSVQKVDNLNNQKSIILSLTELKKEDVELGLVLFNGKVAQLQRDVQKLQDFYKYNITGKYILENESAYSDELAKLSALTSTFNTNVHSYIKTKDTKELQTIKTELEESFNQVNAHIDSIIIQDLRYNEAVFMIFEKAILVTFVIILLGTFWYRKRINDIYTDIKFLSSTDKNYEEYQIFSIEADAIAQRMKRKVVTKDNPAFVDQITGLNNSKGLINAYGDKKGMKEENFTSVTVMEIDNFSKSNRAYSQELTQAILKKIAFTVSLHEQATDIIARTEYNQFTLVLSRASKEQAYKDADIIRQSISELTFKTPRSEKVTVCGGHVVKPGHTSLDEAMKAAKDILNYTKSVTRNKIYQAKDIAEHKA
ncbi:MAG: GGDEF domain-containing protein [Campylobacterota bacterium]|nr:GGDEF domain-containing protein [Campylobacterota bacterium]